ncbi:hypothetical protein EI42_05992 [Thermosporothrix hazakensis]|jgi:hypothetical protein|uniref:Uncharacterized protein n=2 Tax=Thermosporothrix TaxID=768650 RepID=A0A326TSX0_THEHA|nr:hypothetical protein [Thermosporothrix hazakensis]BBH90132.1 hypothetical protein KTC_48830 [Thermosporothrix sp. COM3]PZW19683.1 hypothetical protein EI42_05992 [Thermosporothrix hazakensis]BBH90197.1 hypothetical protein KTC_49480 [Thermosporothrix sp. COM3]BBH90262.1 hypothetical protein KTC_50130 [Thermosporothrix sp. COM3]GCE49205.1 hypothetical protein KTH_40740 [Thermosporothrix hazakensis]
MQNIYISIPEYRQPAQPTNFDDAVASLNRSGGFWRIQTLEKATGNVTQEQWLENAYTDNGVLTMFKALAGASTPSTPPASMIAIDQSLGMASLSAAIPAGGNVTSIQIGSLIGASIPSGTKLVINAGTSNTLTVVTTAAISGAGTVGVQSTPGPTSSIPAGSWVRYDYASVPTADPGALTSPVSYTAPLPAAQFTYAVSGGNSGYGNRSLTVTNNGAYLFSTTGTPPAVAASYTTAWLVSANPVTATTHTFLRVPFDAPLIISDSSNGLITITEKL